MRIIVFGAGGFVGGWICEDFLGRSDLDVVACVRRWSSAVRVARRGISLTQFDLDSRGDLTSLLAGADIVINSSMPPPEKEAELVARLYDACGQAGVRRFIQFSSAAVYGDRTGSVDEGMSPIATDAYGRGKTAMEARLLQIAAEGRPQLFILRPSIIYGPFSDAWTVRYARRIAQGRWRGLGLAGEGTCNLVHAQDVARAVFAAATSEASVGAHVLNINGPEAVSWNSYIERFGDALGINNRMQPRLLSLLASIMAAETARKGGRVVKKYMGGMFAAASRSAGAGRTLIGSAKSLADLYPTVDEVRLLRRKTLYSSALAARDLGFRCTVPLTEGLRQSAEWCKVHGVV